MCDPVTATIITAGLAVATTGYGIATQAKMAKAQTKAINNQLEVTREETRAQATGELFDEMRAARREQGKIMAAAGEAGLGLNSGSIEGLLHDSAMQMELQGDRTVANMESRHASNVADATSMLSQIEKPTVMGAGLQLAGSAMNGWSSIGKAKIQANGG